jgi:hypothetical protein
MFNDKVKNIALTLMVGGPLALGVSYLYDRLNITVSESLDHRIFWVTDDRPGPGDYASFELVHPLAGPEPVLISKQLRCWSGDVLTQENRRFFCNGEFLGEAKSESLTGKPLPLFEFAGIIPEGKAFAYGTHKDSFDSRYWGFVELSAAKRLKAIF